MQLHDLEDVEAFRTAAEQLMDEQRAEEAEAVVREGLRRHPGDASIQAWLPASLLMQGRWREGFREYEARKSRMSVVAARPPMPEWDGPIAGRSFFVVGEQGLGDEIQTARFIPMLRAAGARQIHVACSAPNIRIFERLGVEGVVDRNAPFAVPNADCWVKAWSLPYRLGLGLDDISGAPYLEAEPRGAGGLALVERGNPDNSRDPHRSIPEGMLQRAIPEGRLLSPEGDCYDSLCRLAALDLLITVDTSWAHLAGALGVPCWVLLPYRNLDWRWLRGRHETPWYNSVRLFRQHTPDDWTGVIDQVRASLNRQRRDIPGAGS